MQARVPTNFRQPYRWMGDLDAPSLLFLCVGGTLGMETLLNPGGIVGRIVGGLLWIGGGLVMAYGKYPMERGGDKVWTWLKRLLDFYQRSRKGSMLDEW